MKTYLIVIAFAVVMVLLGGSCKHDPPVGPKAKCDTCITPCDTCKDTTHRVTSNDTTSHNFVWTQSSISGEAGLSGCWVFGTSNIYTVGGSLWKFNGSAWKEVSLIDADRGFSLHGLLSGCTMFAFSETDYWLTDGFPAHSNGSKLTQYRIDSLHAGFLHSSWGTSSSDIYSVGDGGTILHFDGTAWTKMASGTTTNLGHVWGTSDQNIWAAGWDQTTGATALVHFDGSTWSQIDPNTIGYNVGYNPIIGVWTCDSAGHHKDYACGAFVYRNTENSPRWSNDSGKIANSLGPHSYAPLNIMSGNSANDFMVEGSSGFVSHWNGRNWYLYSALYDYGNSSFDTYAFHFKDNTAAVVGGKNGTAWIAIGQR